MAISGGSPTSMQSTLSLPELVDLTRREFQFVNGLEDPNDAMQLYQNEPFPQNSGNSRLINEIDTQTYAHVKAEGVPAKQARVGVGYSVILSVKRVASEVVVTYEMRTQGRYNEVAAKLTSLTEFVRQRRGLDLTHILTFGTSTIYTDMDGNSVDLTVGDSQCLFYSAHTLKFSSTTYSNRLAGDPVFSKGALETAQTMAATQIFSNFGETREMDFNVIICGKDPTTVNDVKQFLHSTSDNTQNNPGVINTHKDEMRLVILKRLATDAYGVYNYAKKKWWGIAAIGMGDRGWQSRYAESEAPNMKFPSKGSNGEDFRTDDWSFGVRGGYGIRVLSGRGIIFSCPTSLS